MRGGTGSSGSCAVVALPQDIPALTVGELLWDGHGSALELHFHPTWLW